MDWNFMVSVLAVVEIDTDNNVQHKLFVVVKAELIFSSCSRLKLKWKAY